MKIFVFIVIYNTECHESEICQSIPSDENVLIHILDNSTIGNNNLEFSKNHGWKYISMNGNQGLSKAYNCALDEADGNEGTIVWFDDDTVIPEDYFFKLKYYITNNLGGDVFLPIVKDGAMILSPCSLRHFRSTPIKNIDKINTLKYIETSGINSGMAINLNVFKNYRYDEKLFLDCVDHQFIKDMRRAKKNIIIMKDVELRQRFSGTQIGISMKDIEQRYNIFKKDYSYFCGNSIIGILYSKLSISRKYLKILNKKVQISIGDVIKKKTTY